MGNNEMCLVLVRGCFLAPKSYVDPTKEKELSSLRDAKNGIHYEYSDGALHLNWNPIFYVRAILFLFFFVAFFRRVLQFKFDVKTPAPIDKQLL